MPPLRFFVAAAAVALLLTPAVGAAEEIDCNQSWLGQKVPKVCLDKSEEDIRAFYKRAQESDKKRIQSQSATCGEIRRRLELLRHKDVTGETLILIEAARGSQCSNAVFLDALGIKPEK